MGRLACLVAAISILLCGTAHAQAPWGGTGTELLPPDPTVPYLPAVPPRMSRVSWNFDAAAL